MALFKNAPQYLLLIVVPSIFTSCAFSAFSDQFVEITPLMSVSSSNIGKGKDIILKVVDERPRQIIGHRGSAQGPAGEIKSKNDVVTIIRDRLTTGLSAKGFHVRQQPNRSTTLMKVEIRLLEYATSAGFATGGVYIRAIFKGSCMNEQHTYESTYGQENTERVYFVPTPSTNELWVNQTAGQALEKLFKDDQMLECLTL